MIKLKRYDEARREIERAIECGKSNSHAAQPWKARMILHLIEQAEGNREAAARARDKAIQLFLAYRRDGGENHEPGGRLCYEIQKALQENKTDQMATLLAQLSNNPEIHLSSKALFQKLQAILGGSRDPGLADDPELRFDDAAEVKMLLAGLA